MVVNHIVVHLRETKKLIYAFQCLLRKDGVRGFWMLSFIAFIVSPFLTNDGVCLLLVEPVLNTFEPISDHDMQLVSPPDKETSNQIYENYCKEEGFSMSPPKHQSGSLSTATAAAVEDPHTNRSALHVDTEETYHLQHQSGNHRYDLERANNGQAVPSASPLAIAELADNAQQPRTMQSVASTASFHSMSDFPTVNHLFAQSAHDPNSKHDASSSFHQHHSHSAYNASTSVHVHSSSRRSGHTNAHYDKPLPPPMTREDAFYFLLALACSSNIGSALTYTGNPQNMIVASDAIDVMPPYKFTMYMLLPSLVTWYISKS